MKRELFLEGAGQHKNQNKNFNNHTCYYCISNHCFDHNHEPLCGRKADLEDRLIQLKLEQAEFEFRLDLQSFPDDKRLSDIEDLNALLEPTEETFILLKRWETVHLVDPDYPYPAAEIKEQDWMAMSYFLYGDRDDEDGAAKADMIYDEDGHIDRDVYDYIGTGDASSDHPVVQEVEKRIKSTE